MTTFAQTHFYDRTHHGKLERFTHYGVSGEPGNGPYVQFWLLVEDGIIRDVGYQTNGCAWSLGIASVVAAVLVGREVERAALLGPKEIVGLVGEIPEGKGHAALMVARGLSACLGSA